MNERKFISKDTIPTLRGIRNKYGAAVKVFDLKTSWLVIKYDKPSWGWAGNKRRPMRSK